MLSVADSKRSTDHKDGGGQRADKGTQNVNFVALHNDAVHGIATLTVNPATLSSLSLNPAELVGGHASQGTVQLNGGVPPKGAVVTLSSSDSAVAKVAATVLIPSDASTSKIRCYNLLS